MAPALILRDGRVWDGLAAEPRSADVVCAGGVVREVGESGTYRAGPEDLEVDLAGCTVLPGLVDSHVYLVWDGSADPVAHVAEDGEQLTAVRAAEHARFYVPSGITTVRDLGGNWDVAITLAKAVDRGHLDGPTIVAAGQTVIMTGGHDPFWGIPCDGPDMVVRGVRGQVAKGAEVIKTAATGGVYGQAHGEEVGASELTYEELAALAHEAHRRGRRVAAHALGEEGVRNAVRAGIDTIEHGIFLADDVLEDMARRGTVLCPTVEVYRRMAHGGQAPDYAVRKARDVVEAHRRSVARAIEAGVPVIAGTDAGAPGMAHPSLVDEITSLQDYGLSSLQALKAATSAAADALGMPAAGRVLPGSPADLLLVDGDPFTDPLLLHRPWAVVRHQELRHS